MTDRFEELAKALAVGVPRREALRHIGRFAAGSLLASLGLGNTAWAITRKQCKEICKHYPAGKERQACVKTCFGCPFTSTTLCGPDGSHLVCVNTAADPKNCGACGNVCPPVPGATPVCNDGVCGYACNAGFIDCGGHCADLTSDPHNCGSCENVCPLILDATIVCNNGVCGYACNAGFNDCGGYCADLTSDPNHCRTCNYVCPPVPGATPVCNNGICGYTCLAGNSDCTGYCANLMNDPNNCNYCGHTCAVDQYCDNGVCKDIAGSRGAIRGRVRVRTRGRR
jgi:hypothetical protein